MTDDLKYFGDRSLFLLLYLTLLVESKSFVACELFVVNNVAIYRCICRRAILELLHFHHNLLNMMVQTKKTVLKTLILILGEFVAHFDQTGLLLYLSHYTPLVFTF